MRFVSLCHQALPSHQTNTQQLIWTATELARCGHQVEVTCRKADAVGTELRNRIVSYYGLSDLPDSINFVPLGSAGSNRISPEVWADVLNVRYAQRTKNDFVHTRDPTALTIALAMGLRCVFETYRLDFNENARLGPWRAINYRRPNLIGIVTHSDVCRRSFIKAGISESRVVTNYNGHAPAHFTPPLTREAARARLGLEKTQRIATYTGHVGITKGIPFLVRVAQQMPDVIFQLVGIAPGSEQGRNVFKLTQEAGATNVRLQPRVSPSEVSTYLFASDCLVIPPSSAPFRRYRRTILPMKTFSYLAAGRPIVAPDLPDLREVLKHDENALLVAPDNVDAAAAAIRSVAFNQNIGDRLGANARRDAAQYTWQARAQRFSAFLESIPALKNAHG